VSSSSSQLRLGPSWLYPLKAQATLARSLVWHVRGRQDNVNGGLRIIFYHRVSSDRDELAVTPSRFSEQMDFLAANGYSVVRVSQAAELLASGHVPPRTLGLCFDDGYRDIAENALPILRAHGFGATVYVASGVIDGRYSFGWYERQPSLLDWDEIVELDREGIFRFGAHTISHPNLLALDEGVAFEEISLSKSALEERIGREVLSFSYPAGLFGERERGLVERAGFSLAVSCEPGVNRAETDRLSLRRIQIGPRDRLVDFRAKVGGGHDAPPRTRALYRRLRYGAASPPAG
jgi:peptidoglycan/xylan/chitin deacetylase (PgdA/CDA1 family)